MIFSESRLIGYVSSDPTRYNRRTAESNAVAQTNTLKNQLANAQYENYGNDVPTNVQPSSMGQSDANYSLPDPKMVSGSQIFGSSVTPQSTAQLDAAKTVYGNNSETYTPNRNQYGVDTGGVTTANRDPRNPTGAPPPVGAKTRTGPIMVAGLPLPPDQQAAYDAARANEQAAIDVSKTEQLKRKQMMQGQATQEKGMTPTPMTPNVPGTPGATPTGTQPIQTTPSQDLITTLKAQAATNPELAQFIPQIEALTSGGANMDAQMQKELDAVDAGSDGVTEAVTNAQDLLKADKDEQDKINLENKSIAEEAAKLAKDMAEIQKAKFELNQARNENLLRESNLENEIRNRRAAAKMGISADTNGLKWMSEEIRKGSEALAFLSQAGDLQEAEFALQIGRQYSLDVRQAINNYDATQTQLDSNFRKEMAEITKIKSMDDKDRREEKQKIREKYWDRKAKEDEKAFGFLKDIYLKTMDQIESRAKDKAAATIKTGDSLKFTSDLRERIEGKEWYKKAGDVTMSYSAMDASWKRYLSLDPETRNRIGIDNSMITSFSKMLDPGSVVRESEYARVPENASALNRLYGKARQFIEGGSGLTEQDLQEMYDTAGAVKKSYDNMLLKKIQPYLMEVDTFNSQENVKTPIQYEQVIQLDIPLPDENYGNLEALFSGGEQSYNTADTDNPEAVGGWLPAAGATPGGYRTDRHNNPTAFTVDIAKQAGLIEGVDYSRGDPFNGGVTARLLGDPIDTTIRVIDKIGFHTGKGGQRWKHTAMSKSDWASLTTNQKRDVVTRMYQKEGGTGVLVQGQPAGQQSTSVAQGMIPTASAADYPPAPAQKLQLPTPASGGPGTLLGMGFGLASAQKPFQMTPKPTVRYQNIQSGAVYTAEVGSEQENRMAASNLLTKLP